jgi:2-polyprenyl-3-methyl-5-hydroxy-6-metoxy-1,4-benzoquinol methylase
MPSEHAPPERLVWTPELVARFWDGVAHTALDAQSFARIAGPLVILAARSHFTPGGQHLDFGAGDGTLTRLMIEAGFPTAACEPAPERRAALERRLAGLDGFLGAEAEAHAPYDAVLMAEVIEHVLDQDLDAVLRTVHGFLKPGGRLVITTPHDEDLEASTVYCPVSNLLFHRWQHVRSLTPASLAALLVPRGFRVRVTHVIEFSPMGFGLPPGILRRLGPLGALWRAVRTRQLAQMFTSGRPVTLGNRSHMLCIADRV